MNLRRSRPFTSLSLFAAVVLAAGDGWAVHYPLGPSKNDWGLKYDVALAAAGEHYTEITFTLADEGRLKPVHSFTLIVLKKQADGGYSYVVKEPLDLKPTADGRQIARLRLRNDLVERAMIRVLTLSVDGRRQTAGAALYNIALQRFLPTAAPSTLASPPAEKTIK